MSNWYCDSKCKISNGGAGPWSDKNKEFFYRMKSAHSQCIGFQIGEPKLRGKANWGNTGVEKWYNGSLFPKKICEMLHILIANTKGPGKCCLIPKKSKEGGEEYI